MLEVYSVAQIRRAEEVAIAEVGAATLMARAAHGLANVCCRELKARRGKVYGAKVLLLVGPGNNGGDGLFAAAQLLRCGVKVLAIPLFASAFPPLFSDEEIKAAYVEPPCGGVLFGETEEERWAEIREIEERRREAERKFLSDVSPTDVDRRLEIMRSMNASLVPRIIHTAGRDAFLAAGGAFYSYTDQQGHVLDAPHRAVPGARLNVDGWRDRTGRVVDDAPHCVTNHDPSWLRGVDLVIDAVTGIGGQPRKSETLRWYATNIKNLRRDSLLIAADIPSGIPADANLEFYDHFQADVTVTFGGLKPCHVIEPYKSACGRVEVIDIGLEKMQPCIRQWEPEDVLKAWPRPEATDHKYTRGVVGIDAGSKQYPGAAVLATAGAVHAGAGMVRYFGEVATEVCQAFPNVVLGAGKVQAVVLGSGWGDRADSLAIVSKAFMQAELSKEKSVVIKEKSVVIDADALRVVPQIVAEISADLVLRSSLCASSFCRRLLTPHAGELAQLLGVSRTEVEINPLTYAQEAANRFRCVVLLKGATQIIAAPNRECVDIAVPGPAWTAQAGSGDVLAGVCGALLAAGCTAATAGVLAASLQAMTAAAYPGPVPPQELARHFSDIIGEL